MSPVVMEAALARAIVRVAIAELNIGAGAPGVCKVCLEPQKQVTELTCSPYGSVCLVCLGRIHTCTNRRFASLLLAWRRLRAAVAGGGVEL